MLAVPAAEPPATEWLKSFDSIGRDTAGGVATTADGSVYFCATAGAAMTLGGTTIPANGFYLARLNATGGVSWVSVPAQLSGEANVRGCSLLADAEGNAYVQMQFLGQYRFGTNVIGAGVEEGRWFPRFCVIKYSSTGLVQWAKTLSKSSDSLGSDTWLYPAPKAAIDRDGEIVFCSMFDLVADPDGTPFGPNGSQDILIGKISREGVIRWIKKCGGPSGDFAFAITTDGGGGIYFGGSHGKPAFFDGIVVNTTSPNGGAFIAKYSSAGVPQWVFTKEVHSYQGNFLDLAVTEDGGIAGVGVMPVNIATANGMAVVLETNKQVRFEQSLGTNKVPHRIHALPGSGFVTASALLKQQSYWEKFDADLLLERFDPSLTTASWQFPVQSGGEDWASGMAMDEQGNLHVAGGFSGGAVFNGQFLSGTGGSGVFLLKLAGEGSMLPVIATEPASTNAWLGSAIRFDVSVQGAGEVSFQWFFKGERIPGATNQALVIPNVTAANEGAYFVEVTNAAGTARSGVAQLVIRGQVSVRVTTVAGTNAPGYVDSTNRTAVRFFRPDGLEYLTGGIVAVADGHNHLIRMLDGAGASATLAGRNQAGYVGGSALVAEFNYPLGLNVEKSLNVIVADSENNVIRRIDLFGLRNVTTVAGTGMAGYVDGPAGVAQFHFPNDLVTDGTGNIFVTEFTNHTVRRISPEGKVTTFAGNGRAGFRDGVGTNAMFNMPAGIEIDSQGNLYVTEWRNHTVRKITSSGVVTTLAGTNAPGLLDGQGSAARFNTPDGITIDPLGNLYVVEHVNHTVRKIDAGGNVVTVAGLGTAGFRDGDRATAMFNGPAGIMWHPEGSLWVGDFENHAIRRIEFLEGTTGEAAELLVTLNPALTIFGKAGATYRIEGAEGSSAAAVMDWKVLATVTLSHDVEQWYDPQPATRKKRFYRAAKVE